MSRTRAAASTRQPDGRAFWVDMTENRVGHEKRPSDHVVVTAAAAAASRLRGWRLAGYHAGGGETGGQDHEWRLEMCAQRLGRPGRRLSQMEAGCADCTLPPYSVQSASQPVLPVSQFCQSPPPARCSCPGLDGSTSVDSTPPSPADSSQCSGFLASRKQSRIWTNWRHPWKTRQAQGGIMSRRVRRSLE